MLPKNFRKNVNIIPEKEGPAQRRELLDKVLDKSTYLPKGVMIEDMDTEFVRFVDEKLSPTIDGVKLPVVFLTLQRWMEFSKTWEFTDKHKDIKIPFITVVRKPDVQPGTDQGGFWNTAKPVKYTYFEVPTFDGVRKGVDIYKIPQPVCVDISYEVRIFCNKLHDLNKMVLNVHKTFSSRQFYISPNGHPMPVVVESIGDESTINDFENRRFYVQLFDMKLMGFILDPDDFEVTPKLNRVMMMFETMDSYKYPIVKVKADKDTSLVTYYVIFKPASNNNFDIKVKYDVKFTELTAVSNLTNIILTLNNNIVTVPFVAKAGDNINITVTKPFQLEGRFTLNGNLI